MDAWWQVVAVGWLGWAGLGWLGLASWLAGLHGGCLGWTGLGWLDLAGWLAVLHGDCLIWFRPQVLAGVFQISAELRKSPLRPHGMYVYLSAVAFPDVLLCFWAPREVGHF